MIKSLRVIAELSAVEPQQSPATDDPSGVVEQQAQRIQFLEDRLRTVNSEARKLTRQLLTQGNLPSADVRDMAETLSLALKELPRNEAIQYCGKQFSPQALHAIDKQDQSAGRAIRKTLLDFCKDLDIKPTYAAWSEKV